MVQERVSIGEMARRLGVAVVTLRRWDREGKLKPLFRTIPLWRCRKETRC